MMGAGGYGPFENDDALDFVAYLMTTTSTGHLSTILSAIPDDSAGSFGHALATGKDPWSEASLGVSTTSMRIASWYSKPLIFPGQLCMAKSSSPAAAVASLRARFSHSCGINVSLASFLGLGARTCERYHGLFSPGSRPTASSQTLSASPTGLRARWACGLMVLGTTKC